MINDYSEQIGDYLNSSASEKCHELDATLQHKISGVGAYHIYMYIILKCVKLRLFTIHNISTGHTEFGFGEHYRPGADLLE